MNPLGVVLDGTERFASHWLVATSLVQQSIKIGSLGRSIIVQRSISPIAWAGGKGSLFVPLERLGSRLGRRVADAAFGRGESLRMGPLRSMGMRGKPWGRCSEGRTLDEISATGFSDRWLLIPEHP